MGAKRSESAESADARCREEREEEDESKLQSGLQSGVMSVLLTPQFANSGCCDL